MMSCCSGDKARSEPQSAAQLPLGSPDQAAKVDASADAPSTPPTGSSDAQSRGIAREDSSAQSSARKLPASPDPQRWASFVIP